MRIQYAALVLIPFLLLAACQREAGSSSSAAPGSGDPVLSFTRVEVGALVTDAASTGGVSWVDFDDDADLDLFVTNGYDVSATEPEPQRNRLYRNLGDGTFEPVTAGPLDEDDGFSSGSTWGTTTTTAISMRSCPTRTTRGTSSIEMTGEAGLPE